VNDDAFARLIAEDVKNNASLAQREYLCMESNLNRWQRGLIALVSNLEEQIILIENDESSDASRYTNMGKDGVFLLSQSIEHYAAKKSKIRRFKFHVEKRLDEVTMMIESGESSSDGYAEFLKAAILKHRELMDRFDLEPTDIDKALWAAVNNSWEFDTIGNSKKPENNAYAS
jgi:hypothetical protein